MRLLHILLVMFMRSIKINQLAVESNRRKVSYFCCLNRLAEQVVAFENCNIENLQGTYVFIMIMIMIILTDKNLLLTTLILFGNSKT